MKTNLDLLDQFNYFFYKDDKVKFHPDLTAFVQFKEYEPRKVNPEDYKDIVGIVLDCESDLHAFGQGSWYHCTVDFNGKTIQCPAGYLINA